VGPFGIPLLEAGKAEDQGVPQGQEDAGGRDCWIRARVRHLAGVKAQSETLVEVGGQGDQGVAALFHP